ncbi:MAG: glucose-1-phosphate thymidylyltransferase-like protein [Ignavibacteria bacterium]|nr:MAG: glucose-1-phosphate thymidylyltransferase-like protein [Ignavibacteria bacterium]KAF0162065.1 MAG: glucose-1-phosphate thymidylyltransferase-like protein [Ignavibacteria bacterium]
MKKNICLFEDEKYENLLPLAFTRPVYDLRCGILTLREKLSYHLPNIKFCLHTRKILHNSVQERNPKFSVNYYGSEDILFINGRLLIDKQTAKEIKKLELNYALTCSGEIIAANVTSNLVEQLFSDDSEFIRFERIKLNSKEISAKLICYPWNLVNENGNQIKSDYSLLVKESATSKKHSSVEYSNKKEIYVARGAKINPFVHLDASDGPIYISKGVHIMSHSLIQGPVFIGEDTVVKAHASIYHDTSIGEVCKVGGEIEASIIHSHSNKQHEGFLGHAYLGSWINLGASTNNSDLKNNYSSVSVLIKGKNVDTKSQFVGLIMGDHSKTAINTMFNTGTIVGVSCNIFGAGFPARYIPSFSWGGSDFLRNYDIEKCIEVARVVFGRRKILLTYAEEELLRNVYELTKHEKVKKS